MRKHMWKNLLTLMISVCLLVSNVHLAWANSNGKNDSKSNIQIILDSADKKEVLGENIIYIYDELDAVIKVSELSDNITMLEIDEGICHNVIKIDKDNQIYLNEKKIETMDEKEKGTEIGVNNVTGWSYSKSPGYGLASDYTYETSTYGNEDLELGRKINELGVIAFAGVVALKYPAVGMGIGLAEQIYEKFVKSETDALSFQTRVTHHKNYPGGWNTSGTYCKQETTTWYAEKNYQGQSTITVHYRIRHMV